MLLDEVDLILHPLKSELNWPMGQKDALDFTREGMRWQVAFHMLDGIMQGVVPNDAHRGYPSTAGLDDSMSARKIVNIDTERSLVYFTIREDLLSAEIGCSRGRCFE